MRPNDYTLHAISVRLQSAIASDKVEIMEETSKVVSSDFIKKRHCLEKIQVENINLRESLIQQRKEDKAQSSEINRLQNLLAQANSEKGKLVSSFNNVSS